MPIELDVWRIDGDVKQVTPARLASEERLEDFLEDDPTLISEDLLVLGRQVRTDYGKHIDLLAVDPEGNLVVIELKRERTPRDVVAQLLDYGSWAAGLSYEDILALYEDYEGSAADEPRFEEAFTNQFGGNPPDTLNETHRLIVVASELDPSTERIVNYLSDQFGVPFNAVFFRYFEDDQREYLTRTWLRDPREVDGAEARARSGGRKREPWNGQDFYVSFGTAGTRRTWADAKKYGFVSGGGGRWYSRTLGMLFPGARVFVCIPQTGYVGVGEVVEESVPVTEFTVTTDDGREVPILEAPLEAEEMGNAADDPDRAEYVVRVDWIRTLPQEQAIWEKGMYANQNTVTKLRNKFTLGRLVDRFGLEE